MAALYSAAPGAWPVLELLALLPLLPETSRRRVRCQVLPPGSSALHIIFPGEHFIHLCFRLEYAIKWSL